MDRFRRRCKIHADNLPHVIHVLQRDSLIYEIRQEKDGFALYSDLTQSRLHEVLKDALCEKQRQSTAAEIPVYSYETLMNRAKFNKLSRFYGWKGFHVLKKDTEKYLNRRGA